MYTFSSSLSHSNYSSRAVNFKCQFSSVSRRVNIVNLNLNSTKTKELLITTVRPLWQTCHCHVICRDCPRIPSLKLLEVKIREDLEMTDHTDHTRFLCTVPLCTENPPQQWPF